MRFLLLAFLVVSVLSKSSAQSFDWSRDGYHNFTKGGTYKNIDGSGINLKIEGLYKDEGLKDLISVQTGSNNQKAEGQVHEYKFIFSEKVDLMFTISDINHSETKNCFNDYMVFSGNPVFSDHHYVSIINDSIIKPDLSMEFKAAGKVDVRYYKADTVIIKHGKGEGCNPGFIFISPIRINQNEAYDSLRISNVLFDSGESVLKPDHFEMLDKLSDFLIQNPSAKITVCGYTDSIGNVMDNMYLSKNRVDAVVSYLWSKDIPQNRIVVKSYGEAQPAKSNHSEEGRRQNRRVEIRIVD